MKTSKGCDANASFFFRWLSLRLLHVGGFWWLGITACYFALQVDYCCISLQRSLTEFPLLFAVLLITSLFYNPLSSVSMSYTIPSLTVADITNQSWSSFSLASALISTSHSRAPLPVEMMSLGFSYNEQFPQVEIQCLKREYWRSSCAPSTPNLYKCP